MYLKKKIQLKSRFTSYLYSADWGVRPSTGDLLPFHKKRVSTLISLSATLMVQLDERQTSIIICCNKNGENTFNAEHQNCIG